MPSVSRMMTSTGISTASPAKLSNARVKTLSVTPKLLRRNRCGMISRNGGFIGYKDSASRVQKQTEFAILPRRRLSKRRLVLRKACKPGAEPNLFGICRGAAYLSGARPRKVVQAECKSKLVCILPRRSLSKRRLVPAKMQGERRTKFISRLRKFRGVPDELSVGRKCDEGYRDLRPDITQTKKGPLRTSRPSYPPQRRAISARRAPCPSSRQAVRAP